MAKIKYDNVTTNYKSYEEFYNNCFYRNILMGAFYIHKISYINEYNDVVIHYSIFNPIYYCITENKIYCNVKNGYVLSDLDIYSIICIYEKNELSKYIKSYYRDSKIKYIDGVLEIEDL